MPPPRGGHNNVWQLNNWFAVNISPTSCLLMWIKKLTVTVFRCVSDKICLNYAVNLNDQPILAYMG